VLLRYACSVYGRSRREEPPIDGAIKFILLLIIVAGRLTSPSNAIVHSNQEPSSAPDLPRHHSGNLPPSENRSDALEKFSEYTEPRAINRIV
jgi:hypothetical protein